jgi:F-type H+-transporting ATPase subunit epsilon
MNLSIVTPLAIVVDEPVTSLRAVDASGSFGILPGHAEFLTRLAISVVSWTNENGVARYCAVRGGALRVTGADIAIATREAVPGDNLETLDREVLAHFRADLDVERSEHVRTTRLQLDLMRRIMGRLISKTGSGTGQ